MDLCRNKGNLRWLWCAIDAVTECVMSFVFGRGKNEVFERPISKL